MSLRLVLVLACGAIVAGLVAPAAEARPLQPEDRIPQAAFGDSRLLSDAELHASGTGLVPRPDDGLMAAVRSIAEPPIGSVGEGRGQVLVGFTVRGGVTLLTIVQEGEYP